MGGLIFHMNAINFHYIRVAFAVLSLLMALYCLVGIACIEIRDNRLFVPEGKAIGKVVRWERSENMLKEPSGAVSAYFVAVVEFEAAENKLIQFKSDYATKETNKAPGESLDVRYELKAPQVARVVFQVPFLRRQSVIFGLVFLLSGAVFLCAQPWLR